MAEAFRERVVRTDDAKEGPQAFMEKRDPGLAVPVTATSSTTIRYETSRRPRRDDHAEPARGAERLRPARCARRCATAWQPVKDDPSVHAVVLRAAGDRAFCAGLDTKKPYGQPDDVWNHEDPGELLSPKWQQVWKPVVCAVQGICTAGAFYFLNEADIVICSDDATFFDSHVTYGLVSALEPVGLMRKVGLAETLRIALSGNDERVTADTALRIGLVTEVVARDRAVGPGPRDRRGHRPASRPSATQGTVRAIWESLDRPVPRRHAAGPHLHAGRQPDRRGRGRREGPRPPEAEAPLMAEPRPALSRLDRRGARARPVGAGARVRAPLAHVGRPRRDGRRGRRRWSSRGSGSGCCCATARPQVGLLLGAAAGRRLRGDRQPRTGAPSGCGPTSRRSASAPSPASRPTSRRSRRAGALARPATQLGDGRASAAASRRPAAREPPSGRRGARC